MSSEKMCFNCKHQYLMVYRTALKCMNQDSESYGEDVDPSDTCDCWESMKGADDE